MYLLKTLRMKNNVIFLIIILVLALILRVLYLDRVPPSLFGDEIDVGYQAHSLLKTGKDISGRFLPFYIKSLAEYRTPLYIYSAVPFVGVFGLNEWGVRLPAVFWGMISILTLFLLVRKLFNFKIAAIASLLLTISPWHLQYSRSSFEVTMLLSFIVLGVYSLTQYIEKKRVTYLLTSVILLGLTPYIYSTAVIFTPLLILLLGAVFLTNKDILRNRGHLLIGLFVLLLTTIPMFYSIYSGEARGRFEVISIFQDSVLLDKINLARSSQKYYSPLGEVSTQNPLIEAVLHNKLTVFTQVFSLNYLNAFSFYFLFGSGDPNFRQSIFEMGELYFFEIITIFLGIYYLLTRMQRKVKYLIFGWLLISPIPASLTTGGGLHATRLFLMIAPLTILSALGIFSLINERRKVFKGLTFILIVLALINIIFYFHRYFIHYPIESWRWWHVGFKEAINFVQKKEASYGKVIINNSYEPSLIRYLFYTNYDPKIFHQQFKGEQEIKDILPGINGFSLGNKVYFAKLDENNRGAEGFEKVMKKGMLYMASARDEVNGDLRTYEHQNFKILKTIVNPAGEPIFFVLAGK